MQHDGTFQVVKVTLDSGESLEATAGHPFYIQGKGWNVAANRKVGDALQLHNGITLVIKTVETSTRFAKVYNFSVAQNANHFVWKDGVLVHNGNICGTDKVKDILKNRRGSVKDAPLPEGSPSWNEVLDIVILTYCCTFRGITPLRGVLSLLAGQTHYGTTG